MRRKDTKMKVVVTGLTEEEFKKQLEDMKHGKSYRKRCYICKREEGQKVILIDEERVIKEEKEPFLNPPLVLEQFEMVFEEDVFEFSVCIVCMALFARVLPKFKDHEVPEEPRTLH